MTIHIDALHRDPYADSPPAKDRQELQARARRYANDMLHRWRPPEYLLREKWQGLTCEDCGEVRERSNYDGCFCSCERALKGRHVDEYQQEHGPDTAMQLWLGSGVPPRFQECRFENFERRPGTEKAVKAARDWADGFDFGTDTGLFLAGPYGSGKTHLATAAARVALGRCMPDLVWLSAGSLIHRVRAGDRIDWGPVDRAVAAELLVLDDLGQEVGSDFTRDIVARVICGRYDSSDPTIITSNLGPKALEKALGGAIVSRLHEMTEPLALTAGDYRRKRNMGVA